MVVKLKLQNGEEVRVVGNPIKMSGTPCDTYDPPVEVGQNTHEILTRFLGYSPEQIDQLRKEKVI
jgi:crotonobetainyl-CoA:carnitine CoA-transferase CaiB-like acyl-CoA transferase